MKSHNLRILFVEDNPDDVDLVVRDLSRGGLNIEHLRVENAGDMRAALARDMWDLIISDYTMPQFSAAGALGVLKESGLDVPLIVISGTIGEERAVALLKEGASDFVSKGMLARLVSSIQRELREASTRRARREAEKALRESAERIRTVINASPLAQVLINRERVVTMWNPAADRILGWKAAQTVGSKLPFPDGAFATRFAELCSRTFAGESFTAVEVTFETSAGARRLATLSLVPLGSLVTPGGAPDGQIDSLLALFEDITERRQLERQLVQAQKMDAIGKLAGGVAHDFNNLLTVINGRSHRILAKLQPEDPLWREADIIHQTGERAIKLVRQLLAFSRKQAGQVQNIALNATLTDMVKMLHSMVGEGVELVTVLEPGLRSIVANPAQIEQVVVNLVVNAADAMPQGGRLTIQTAKVRIDETEARRHVGAKAGPYISLSVSDTGEGMDDATQAQIFEPFFTTKAQGTGLGLATVYGIVTQAGGFISVNSAPGMGATFRVLLPIGDATALPTNTPSSGFPVLDGHEAILVVEDEEDVRSLVVQVLEAHGYQVSSARDWIEAFGIAKTLAGRIKLLLTDVVMPQMSGREVAASLTPLCPGMKVLYMSGYADSAIVQHGVLEPGINFIQKPFSPDGLLRAIRKVLNKA